MKPPTISELREIAGNHHGGADFYEQQLKTANFTEDERKNEQRMARNQKLIALACERWAEQIAAMQPGA